MSSLTLTIIANITSNYGEGLGNVSSVQKVFRNGKVYAIRTRESLKNAIMVQAGMYDDLVVSVDGATQKHVNEEVNVANCRALEGGYMNTTGKTVIRNSSFYITDAVACSEYVIETRFHNNLYLAQTYANQNSLNLQNEAGKCGLMPYQYEYDKDLKQYSITIDLDMIGVDKNFNIEADNSEKSARVNNILTAIENLSLVVKGNLDNAEPIFAVGGIVDRKTHYFENVVRLKDKKLIISDDLKARLNNGCDAALLKCDNFDNEKEISEELNTLAVSDFFNILRKKVNEYYEV